MISCDLRPEVVQLKQESGQASHLPPLTFEPAAPVVHLVRSPPTEKSGPLYRVAEQPLFSLSSHNQGIYSAAIN